MKVKRSSFIFSTISLLGFGKERKRWLKSGRIRVSTTVILPMTVRFRRDHCFINCFISKILSSKFIFSSLAKSISKLTPSNLNEVIPQVRFLPGHNTSSLYFLLPNHIT